jgi:hypothetical protein
MGAPASDIAPAAPNDRGPTPDAGVFVPALLGGRALLLGAPASRRNPVPELPPRALAGSPGRSPKASPSPRAR